MTLDPRPIGVFDSGIGGLLVASRISQHLPCEGLVYVGDTAHTPWGNRPVTDIQNYCLHILEFLQQQDCKAIVVACNTASAVALDSMRAHLDPDIPLINVLDPVVNYLSQHYAQAHIGLLGTQQTIQSNRFRDKMAQLMPQAKLFSLAAPLLVPLIEGGYANEPICTHVLEQYLAQLPLSQLQALILGCTHYPLLIPQLQRLCPGLRIIDANALTAELLAQRILPAPPRPSQHCFYLTAPHPFFRQLLNQLFTAPVHLQTCHLGETQPR